jgi:hypothetical protein
MAALRNGGIVQLQHETQIVRNGQSCTARTIVRDPWQKKESRG